jgi:uncharacterized protein YjbI with pentapeptide repeats
MRPLTDIELELLLEQHQRSAAAGDADMLQMADVDLRACRLAGRDLRRVAFSDAELSGCDLRGAMLGGARLARVRAVQADLTGSSLFEASLADVDLSGAKLDDADLSAGELHRANLTDATLARAALTKATIIDCVLDNAILREARGLRLLVLRGSMRNVDVSGAEFGHAIFRAVDLEGTDLSRAARQGLVLPG